LQAWPAKSHEAVHVCVPEVASPIVEQVVQLDETPGEQVLIGPGVHGPYVPSGPQVFVAAALHVAALPHDTGALVVRHPQWFGLAPAGSHQ
jgi:hypothetical protein